MIPKLLRGSTKSANLMVIGGLMFGVNEEEIQSSPFEKQGHLRIEAVFKGSAVDAFPCAERPFCSVLSHQSGYSERGLRG